MMTVREQDRQKSIEKLRELIQGVKIAMLTTVTPGGRLHTRPMYTYDTEFDGDLWFLTGLDTSKIQEIQNDQQVNLAYADPGKNRYVSVSGVAHISNDRDRIRDYWNPLLKAWFDGPEDPNIRLLKISVTEAEYWDGPSGLLAGILVLARAATGGEIPEGENESLRLK